MTNFLTKARAAYNRRVSRLLFRRAFAIETDRPLISFSFDDFPESALRAGGAILRQFDAFGTYYVSLGLLGHDTPSGHMFGLADLAFLVEQGHELGCHTFSHCHSGDTPPQLFEKAILENRIAAKGLLPGTEFQTFSYPISSPRPLTKWRASRHFRCCRGGGQTFNSGTADLNNLAAYFLEKAQHRIEPVKEVIDRNAAARGWLIFATHDIADAPTPFGCRPRFFEDVVRYAVASGAQILPVAGALDALGAAVRKTRESCGSE